MKTSIFPLRGGLDLVTPAVETQPGRVVVSINYEPSPRGYKRIDGFERYDGRPSPSSEQDEEAARAAIQPVPGTGPIRGVWEYKGDIYAFRDSADGTECIMHKATANGWEAIEPSILLPFEGGGGFLIEFNQNNIITADTAADAVIPSVGDTIQGLQYTILTRQSGKVVSVGGSQFVWWSGQIRKIIIDEGAFSTKDAVGRMVVTTNEDSVAKEPIAPSSFGFSIPGYIGSNVEKPMTGIWVIPHTSIERLAIEPYDIITGLTSEAEAVVSRIRIREGSWDQANAVGELLLVDVAGTFVDEGVTVGTDTDYLGGHPFAQVKGADMAPPGLPPGGRYSFVNYNFLGSSTAVLDEIPDSELTLSLEPEPEPDPEE